MWALLLGLGLMLLLVPVLALRVTNRAPDVRFTHAWWSPFASVPRETLALGSVGAAVAVAVAVSGLAALAVRRLPRATVGVVLLVALLATAQIGAWLVVSARQERALLTVARSVVGSQAVSVPDSVAAAQAVRALQLAAAPSNGRRTVVVGQGSVLAGPWLVQRLVVVNQGAQDEYARVAMGGLVDPFSGRVIAAWFWGL